MLKKENRNYIKGRAFEYKTAIVFRRKGYFVTRSAGSHGVADLVAIKKGKRPLLIQCKAGTGSVDVEEHNLLYKTALIAGSIPIIASAENRKPTVYKAITGIAIKKGDEEKVIKKEDL